jgi:hypothetical protein
VEIVAICTHTAGSAADYTAGSAAAGKADSVIAAGRAGDFSVSACYSAAGTATSPAKIGYSASIRRIRNNCHSAAGSTTPGTAFAHLRKSGGCTSETGVVCGDQ